jgi:hypothetical protein
VKIGTTANQKQRFFNLRKAKSKISALDEGDLHPNQVKQIARCPGVIDQEVIDMNAAPRRCVAQRADPRRRRDRRSTAPTPPLSAISAVFNDAGKRRPSRNCALNYVWIIRVDRRLLNTDRHFAGGRSLGSER